MGSSVLQFSVMGFILSRVSLVMAYCLNLGSDFEKYISIMIGDALWIWTISVKDFVHKENSS